MILSACGLKCDECEFFGKSCTGCLDVKGSTFWAREIPGGVCPLYDCAVNKKQYKNCGECAELPCNIFRMMKDPSSSDEEHQKSILDRVSRLTSN